MMHSTENLGSGLGLYLYCLYPVPRYPKVSSAKPSGATTWYGVYRAGGSLPDLVGIDGDHKVFTLSCRDVNAAVSSVSLKEFGSRALEQRIGNLEWVAPRVLIHERIIEEIITVYPVMPMRFCTIFATRDRIEELVNIHHAKIVRFFSDISGKEEWGIKGYINGGRLEKAERLSPPVQDVDIKLPGASPGLAYLLRRKRDLAIQDGLSGRAMQVAEEVFQGLLAYAARGVRNKTLQLEGDEGREEMILNAAFLVLKGNVRIFRHKVKETEEKYRSRGFTLSVTGPWPPYNFCPVFGDEVKTRVSQNP